MLRIPMHRRVGTAAAANVRSICRRPRIAAAAAATSFRVKPVIGSSIPGHSIRSFTTFITRECNGGDEDIIPDLKERLLKAMFSPTESTSSKRHILLLLTPSHAAPLVSNVSVLDSLIDELIRTGNEQVSQSSEHLINNKKGQACGKVKLVAAVVDALPSSTSTNKRTEGWSAMVTDRPLLMWTDRADQTHPFKASANPPDSHIQHKRAIRERKPKIEDVESSPDEPGTLSISLTRQDLQTETETGQPHAHLAGFQVVTMNLANTLFHTGTIATATSYITTHIRPKDKSNKGSGTTIKDIKSIKHICLVLNGSLEINRKISFPLQRLTGPAKVYSATGNILKDVIVRKSDGTKDEIVAASKGLETAVAEWHKTHPAYNPDTYEKNTMAIFARIVKGGKSPPAEFPMTLSQDSKSVDSRPWSLLRVVSGGGGWGNQGGILALDSQFSDAESYFGKTVGIKPPEDIAELGDWVEFYVAVEPEKSPLDDSVQGLVFETLEKEEELITTGNTTSASNEADTSKRVAGAAVEGGMWLSRRKLDVPGMRVILEYLGEKEVKHIEQPPKYKKATDASRKPEPAHKVGESKKKFGKSILSAIGKSAGDIRTPLLPHRLAFDEFKRARDGIRNDNDYATSREGLSLLNYKLPNHGRRLYDGNEEALNESRGRPFRSTDNLPSRDLRDANYRTLDGTNRDLMSALERRSKLPSRSISEEENDLNPQASSRSLNPEDMAPVFIKKLNELMKSLDGDSGEEKNKK